METRADKISAHPFSNEDVSHTNARIYLPVAPKCNVQCNFCNHTYDCVNENRPGSISSVLTPFQAIVYLKALEKRMDNLKVIGIAGPGDPFANARETLETMRWVHEEFPDKVFCLSTNGLELGPHIDAIASLGVTQVTLTVNAVDPEIVAKIYQWVRFDKHVYRGMKGAKILLKRQLECIPRLKARGIEVKINSILIPGINEGHIREVARTCGGLGADVISCIPLTPLAETAFASFPEPGKTMLFKTRSQAAKHLDLMSPCSRYGRDVAGLLGQTLGSSHSLLREYASRLELENRERPYVAVATREGLLVNRHLSECRNLYIFRLTPKGYQFVEQRSIYPHRSGNQRWVDLAELLGDCRAILVNGVDEIPRRMMKSTGIHVIETTGLIYEGLDGIYRNRGLRSISGTDAHRQRTSGLVVA